MTDPDLARSLLHCLDLTSLGEDDSPAHIARLCRAALAAPIWPAAICVYPEHITTTRRQLAAAAGERQPPRVASVVNFPDGGSDPDRVIRECRRAIAAGAEEIDAVLPWRALQIGDSSRYQALAEACRTACGQATVKFIVESALLTDEQLDEACTLALAAGADFLKTSTGKNGPGASMAAATRMLRAIAESGRACGFKASGGIRTIDQARSYADLVQQQLRLSALTPDRFRIGASGLHAELLAAIGG